MVGEERLRSAVRAPFAGLGMHETMELGVACARAIVPRSSASLFTVNSSCVGCATMALLLSDEECRGVAEFLSVCFGSVLRSRGVYAASAFERKRVAIGNDCFLAYVPLAGGVLEEYINAAIKGVEGALARNEPLESVILCLWDLHLHRRVPSSPLRFLSNSFSMSSSSSPANANSSSTLPTTKRSLSEMFVFSLERRGSSSSNSCADQSGPAECISRIFHLADYGSLFPQRPIGARTFSVVASQSAVVAVAPSSKNRASTSKKKKQGSKAKEKHPLWSGIDKDVFDMRDAAVVVPLSFARFGPVVVRVYAKVRRSESQVDE